MWKKLWDPAVWTECLWRTEMLDIKLEHRVDVVKVRVLVEILNIELLRTECTVQNSETFNSTDDGNVQVY
jgi:hypothetical protein